MVSRRGDTVARMARVRFRVLGALEVEVDGVAAELGGARQRTVLAVLLLHANEPVATDRLVTESWGENAPTSATKTAQVYVSRLRGTLGNETLTATPGGYLLGVAPGALDTDELEELRARAREADPREAGRLLRQGLALWRGPPYADLRYEEALQAESDASKSFVWRRSRSASRPTSPPERRHSSSVSWKRWSGSTLIGNGCAGS